MALSIIIGTHMEALGMMGEEFNSAKSGTGSQTGAVGHCQFTVQGREWPTIPLTLTLIV